MKSFYIVFLVVVALLTGCDSVGSDERLIEIPAATVQRNVLIEDLQDSVASSVQLLQKR